MALQIYPQLPMPEAVTARATTSKGHDVKGGRYASRPTLRQKSPNG